MIVFWLAVGLAVVFMAALTLHVLRVGRPPHDARAMTLAELDARFSDWQQRERQKGAQ